MHGIYIFLGMTARWKVMGPIHTLLADDHRRLEAILDRATADPARIDPTEYGAFRAGLLKHIGMEEKILLPAAQQQRGGEPLPIAATLRLQHGAIAALLVPTPTADVVATLRLLLEVHNPLEEDPGGMYEACETIRGMDSDGLLARLRAAPEVPVASHVDGPRVLAAARRALTRAGFDVAALPLTRKE
jgi:hypothetical protein